MEDSLIFKDLEIRLQKSHRAKYLKLSVSRAGIIKLSTPRHTTIDRISKFLMQQEEWLKKTIDKLPKFAKLNYINGETISILDTEYSLTLIESPGRSKSFTDHDQKKIFLFHSGATATKLRELLKKQLVEIARIKTTSATANLCQQHGISYQNISIREQKSRWGSCSSNGNLSYNWKIILAPKPVFEYVIAHEVAHLVEHNHSKRFWDLVEKLQPQHSLNRHWLKHNSHLLEII